MKFSVVTISFNQAEFLERTIQSVLSQEGVEIEYIVVDPGSTDGSREIIGRYLSRISHVIYDRDEGPADGLNKGFALATGDVYCYLNSDDTLEPNALAKAASHLERASWADVIFGHAWVIDRSDVRLRRVWSEPYRRCMVAYGSSVQIQPSTFIRRGAFLQSGGFNKGNTSTWDGELLVDLFLSGARFKVVDEFFSNYRLHAASITNSGSKQREMIENGRRRFVKLMGRDIERRDSYIGYLTRIAKHVVSPRQAWERLMFGPVFNRGID